ncbi:SurA N-terminal domain-containing protein [Streptosporangiaceae bacterium NEAU-GS5]|nr:SurA N-terminal domain-containing protein [Streptosporangiaceae bacterium NEAU-GS5]
MPTSEISKKSIRVLLVAVAAGAALVGCGPVHAGAAAIVGQERITSDRLDADVRSYQQYLTSHKINTANMQLAGSVPQVILQQIMFEVQTDQYATSKGITVTPGEIDAVLTQVAQGQGGMQQLEQVAVQSGITPARLPDAIKALVQRNKLLQQMGAGQDQAAQQAAAAKLAQEMDKVIPLRVNPRYGQFDATKGWVADERFGKIPASPAPAAATP